MATPHPPAGKATPPEPAAETPATATATVTLTNGAAAGTTGGTGAKGTTTRKKSGTPGTTVPKKPPTLATVELGDASFARINEAIDKIAEASRAQTGATERLATNIGSFVASVSNNTDQTLANQTQSAAALDRISKNTTRSKWHAWLVWLPIILLLVIIILLLLSAYISSKNSTKTSEDPNPRPSISMLEHDKGLEEAKSAAALAAAKADADRAKTAATQNTPPSGIQPVVATPLTLENMGALFAANNKSLVENLVPAIINASNKTAAGINPQAGSIVSTKEYVMLWAERTNGCPGGFFTAQVDPKKPFDETSTVTKFVDKYGLTQVITGKIHVGLVQFVLGDEPVGEVISIDFRDPVTGKNKVWRDTAQLTDVYYIDGQTVYNSTYSGDRECIRFDGQCWLKRSPKP